jgi:hypothetical protein
MKEFLREWRALEEEFVHARMPFTATPKYPGAI